MFGRIVCFQYGHITYDKLPDYASSRNLASTDRETALHALLLCGITDSFLLSVTHITWANCTNAPSVLCSSCGSISTVLCSVLAARAVVPSHGWPALHTNTLLFATSSAAELLNMSAGLQFPASQWEFCYHLQWGDTCALLDACSLSLNRRFVNVAVCQLLYSRSIRLWFL